MLFNPNPNKQVIGMLFSCKRVDQNHSPLVSDHKHIGTILDCKHLFTKHISEKIVKACKGIGIIRLLSSHVPSDAFDQLYQLFVCPI